ncbi:MAG: histidine kinase [Ardenticatenales bacterium]|nr:histidine kinase [Ardenticatenales bacterium]
MATTNQETPFSADSLLVRWLASPRLRRQGSILIATLLMLLLLSFLRWNFDLQPLEASLLAENFDFEPYLFGVAFQELLVPIVLLFLFSRTPLFRRLVTSEKREPADTLKLILALIVLQLLFGLYRFGFTRFLDGSQVSFGFFFVIVAGLLGGWPAGLILGLFSFVLMGGMDILLFHTAETANLSFADILFDYFLFRPRVLGAIWLGTVIGLWAELLGARRYLPANALRMAIVAEVSIVAFAMLSEWGAEWYVTILLPNLVITSLALIFFVMTAQSVQAEAGRQQADQARLELAQAELALTQAKLTALRAQINPHFLFNSINTIRYFVRTDPETARELLGHLSEIFQRSLQAGELVPLQDEISYARAYLALEQARLDERLQVIWTNMAPELLDHEVPTLFLQPIVENAVVHGLATQEEGGRLHIIINRSLNDLIIQVQDDGAGFDPGELARWREGGQREIDPAGKKRESIGLRNIDERLRTLYGPTYGLIIQSEIGSGSTVIIKLPLEPEGHAYPDR